jgi:hypothetical protein
MTYRTNLERDHGNIQRTARLERKLKTRLHLQKLPEYLCKLENAARTALGPVKLASLVFFCDTTSPASLFEITSDILRESYLLTVQ